MGQIQQLDSSLQRAKSAYDSATAQLGVIEHNLKINKIGLHAARANLVKSQVALERRLVVIYTTRDDQSTLAVLLGAQSIDDLVNRIETVQSVSSQDVAVMNQVISFKHQVTALSTHSCMHATSRSSSLRSALQRRPGSARSSAGSSACSRRSRVRSRASSRSSRPGSSRSSVRRWPRYTTEQQQQALALQDTVVGASATTSDGSVAPPSQYGGVVGIAMRYLGTPYVWGGSSPGGFDCSGLVAYVYSQVGVSLPHYTGAQWNVGVPVSRDDLQPGDLVFFDGLGHVGLYIGGGQFIHAPHSGDVVKISSLSESWYAATYDGARRITG